jgi:hypothetical protein
MKGHIMKKVLIGMVAGAMALGAGVAPVVAGTNEQDTSSSIWENLLDNGDDTLTDLVLIAGMSTMLDDCGNGKPFYTLFAPNEVYLDGVLDALGVTVSDLQQTPAAVKGILNDHLVNGAFSPWQLDLDEITTLTARSGFTLRNENGDEINDQSVDWSEQSCNGWIYWLDGFIDSTPQVPTEGLNSLDTPQDGTPGGSNSLPNTR